MMLHKTAEKRLKAEYQRMIDHPTEGISARPGKQNLFVWKAVILGPPGTCYEGGVFNAKLEFPKCYPMKPPKMHFTSEMFHPNIFQDGRVCMSILYNPVDGDPGDDRWSPVQSVEKVLLSVVSLLAEPSCIAPLNLYAAWLWFQDREQFNQIVKQTVDKTRGNRPTMKNFPLTTFSFLGDEKAQDCRKDEKNHSNCL